MTAFTIGCDPELFLIKRDGSPMSAYGVVQGTKKEPFKVENGAYQVDGMALEFNTDPVPVKNQFDVFNRNITTVIKRLKEDVKAAGYKSARFNIVPVQDFGEEIMAQQPEEAKELGCDPDWSAYTKAPNPRPDGDVTFRTASGHIHVGWGADIPVEHPNHIDICCDFIKCMDATVGMFMTLIDTDPRRRELYGKAGAFRPKPYGVEYRTPSNLWLTHVNRRKVIYHLVNIAIKINSSGGQFQSYVNGCKWDTQVKSMKAATAAEAQSLVQETIDKGDKDIALQILKNVFSQTGWDGEIVAALLKTELKRMDKTVRPHDHIVQAEVVKGMKIA